MLLSENRKFGKDGRMRYGRRYMLMIDGFVKVNRRVKLIDDLMCRFGECRGGDLLRDYFKGGCCLINGGSLSGRGKRLMNGVGCGWL